MLFLRPEVIEGPSGPAMLPRFLGVSLGSRRDRCGGFRSSFKTPAFGPASEWYESESNQLVSATRLLDKEPDEDGVFAKIDLTVEMGFVNGQTLVSRRVISIVMDGGQFRVVPHDLWRAVKMLWIGAGDREEVDERYEPYWRDNLARAVQPAAHYRTVYDSISLNIRWPEWMYHDFYSPLSPPQLPTWSDEADECDQTSVMSL